MTEKPRVEKRVYCTRTCCAEINCICSIVFGVILIRLIISVFRYHNRKRSKGKIVRQSDGLSSISSFHLDNQSNSKKKHECRSIMYVMLNQRLSPFKNQRISQTRTPNAMETKHKLRQVNKNKWEFEIDTVGSFRTVNRK